MNKIIYILVLIIISASLFSCRFSKPLLSHKATNNHIKTDLIVTTYTYNYLRISKHGLFGRYTKKIVTNKDRSITSITHTRNSTNKLIRDGYAKHKVKTIHYKNSIPTKKSIFVYKNKGRAGKLKCSKIYYFDDKGDKIKTVNLKNN